MSSIPPTLPTGRLLLRPLTGADGPALEPMLNDAVVREMFRRPAGEHISGAQWVAGQLEARERETPAVTSFSWAIVLAGTAAAIGLAQLSNISFYEGAEPALFLSPHHRSQGYGLEVVNELVRWAFEDLVPYWARTGDGADAGYRLGRVTALVMPQNTASIRMLSKTALVDGGVITVQVRPSGTTEARAFSLSRHEYQQYKAGHAG